ncbi:hypothetical protein KUL49_13830 [Alteromonas sp. KUL49]|nr:hypothetical protein KUL49_13830 [Alteromonas sp. KUL49]
MGLVKRQLKEVPNKTLYARDYPYQYFKKVVQHLVDNFTLQYKYRTVNRRGFK